MRSTPAGLGSRLTLSLSGLVLALATNACSSGADMGGMGGKGTGGGSSTSSSSSSTATATSSSSSSTGGFTMLYAFDTSTDVGAAQIADSSDTDPNDLGVNGTTKATANYDPADGDPDSGSLKITLPCTAYNQFVDYQFIFPVNQDLGNKTLSVMIKLDSGFTPDASAPGGLILYAKSGDNWDWGQATWANIGPDAVGVWKKYTFSMSAPDSGSTPSFDPGQLRSIGIKIDTGAGGTATAMPTPAVFHVDSIGYQ